MVWVAGIKRWYMMMDTNEHGDFPRTGKKAKNNARKRTEESLIDKYPSYYPDPACMVCGGEGRLWTQKAVYDIDGECVDVDFIDEPCDCIFHEKMTVIPDPKCLACGGTGEVEEAHVLDGETVIHHYACICLRYVPKEDPKAEGDNNE